MSLMPKPEEMLPVLEPGLPISSLLAICISHFTTLISTLSSQDRDTDLVPTLQEELGRIRVWAGNLGAQRDAIDEQSLENRLKNSPELRGEVADHFHDLYDALNEGKLHLPNQAFKQCLMLLSHHDRIRKVNTI